MSLIFYNITIILDDQQFNLKYISIGRENINNFKFKPYACNLIGGGNNANSNMVNNIYEVAAPHDSDPDYTLPDVYSVLTDGDDGSCLKLKNHACVKFPTIIEFRTSE